MGIFALLAMMLSVFPYCGNSLTGKTESSGEKPAPLPDLVLTCNPDSFSLITSRYKEDIYVMATLQIGKKVWQKVRLRVRGDTSRSFPKKSLKLKIPKGKDLPFGRDDLNLNAEYLDHTYMRQYLATRVFQDSGHPCYNATHVKVHLNGAYLGLFLLVQNVDKGFLEQWGMSKKGDLFKATKDHACLNNQGEILQYWERKGPKGDTSWTALAELIRVLNDTPDTAYARMLHEVFQYKNVINTIAVNMLLGNRSTYYHNYFMYRSVDKHQWRYLPWDMDKTFVLAEIADEYHRGNLSDSKAATMESNPFFERALAIPTVFEAVQRRMDTLVATVFSPKHLYPILDSLERVLAPEIAADTFYQRQTLDQWHSEIAEIKTYIAQRPLMLKNQFEHAPTSFQLLPAQQQADGSTLLTWRSSHDPDGDLLTYSVVFSLDPKFSTGKAFEFAGLSDTTMVVPSSLQPGTYFWKVLAVDPVFMTRGFDNIMQVEVRPR